MYSQIVYSYEETNHKRSFKKIGSVWQRELRASAYLWSESFVIPWEGTIFSSGQRSIASRVMEVHVYGYMHSPPGLWIKRQNYLSIIIPLTFMSGAVPAGEGKKKKTAREEKGKLKC